MATFLKKTTPAAAIKLPISISPTDIALQRFHFFTDAPVVKMRVSPATGRRSLLENDVVTIRCSAEGRPDNFTWRSVTFQPFSITKAQPNERDFCHLKPIIWLGKLYHFTQGRLCGLDVGKCNGIKLKIPRLHS